MVQKAFKLATITIGATTIKGIESSALSNNVVAYALQGNGSLDPFNYVTLKMEQMLTFTTTDIKTFLDACGISGLAVTSSAKAIFYYRQLADGGVYAASGSDISLTVNKGKLVFQSITANEFGQAIITASIIPTFDGTNIPVILAINATAPTLTRETDLFTFGSLSINSVGVPINNWRLEMNNKIETAGSDGQPYVTEAFTLGREPKFSCDHHNFSLPATIGALIGQPSGGDVVTYLRKFTVGGGMIPDATASHIKFTMKDAQITSNGFSANGLDLGGTSIMVAPVFNGTDLIVAIDTASAIS